MLTLCIVICKLNATNANNDVNESQPQCIRNLKKCHMYVCYNHRRTLCCI